MINTYEKRFNFSTYLKVNPLPQGWLTKCIYNWQVFSGYYLIITLPFISVYKDHVTYRGVL